MHKLPLVTLKLRGGFFIASNTFPLPVVAGFLFSGPDQSNPIVSLLIADRGPEPITHSTPT